MLEDGRWPSFSIVIKNKKDVHQDLIISMNVLYLSVEKKGVNQILLYQRLYSFGKFYGALYSIKPANRLPVSSLACLVISL